MLYSGASTALAKFAEATGVPVCETQGGKSSLPDDHPLNMAAVGVTGTSAANRLAEEADVLLAVGTRLQDFTTGSWALFKNAGKTIDRPQRPALRRRQASRHNTGSRCARRAEGTGRRARRLEGAGGVDRECRQGQGGMAEGRRGGDRRHQRRAAFRCAGDRRCAAGYGFRRRSLLHAAGGLPGELHKLWQAGAPGSYHAEYGYSCMGYEIAGGLGVKMAKPDEEVVVMLGDGSYLMLNSEIATSVMLGLKLTIVLLDNRGYGCINRLQMGTGGANFNNLLKDSRHETLPDIDFAAHAASLGAISDERCRRSPTWSTALGKAKEAPRTTVIVIDTDPLVSTEAGGHWWDVAVPEVSQRKEVKAARKAYEDAVKLQRVGD